MAARDARQAADLRFEVADARRWADVVDLFGTKGDPSWCWCQFFLTTGRSYETSAEHNRGGLRREVSSDEPDRSVGLVAYAEDQPVGWVQLGPRTRFPRVGAAQVDALSAAGVPPDGAWRVTCFVVRVGHRRKGIAAALLDAAVAHAREQGARVVEAHPVDVAARANPRTGGAQLYPGVLTTFLAAGFREVARTSATRPLVVLDLAAT